MHICLPHSAQKFQTYLIYLSIHFASVVYDQNLHMKVFLDFFFVQDERSYIKSILELNLPLCGLYIPSTLYRNGFYADIYCEKYFNSGSQMWCHHDQISKVPKYERNMINMTSEFTSGFAFCIRRNVHIKPISSHTVKSKVD